MSLVYRRGRGAFRRVVLLQQKSRWPQLELAVKDLPNQKILQMRSYARTAAQSQRNVFPGGREVDASNLSRIESSSLASPEHSQYNNTHKSEIQPRLPCLSALATYDDDHKNQQQQQQPPSMISNNNINSSLPPPMLPRKEQKFLEAAVTSLAKHILLERRRQFSTSTGSVPGPDPVKDPDPVLDPSAATPPPIETPEVKPEKKKFRRKRMNVPNYGPDADEAIVSLQAARKDRAHAKTSANIRRALYGNVIICVAKLGAWVSSGSSSMMSEFVHSVVDCGNQSLLLMGLRDSRNTADKLHPYGYGKAVYFWALVSALGTFFLGAGVSMSHAVGEIMEPSLSVISPEVWGVLALSFVVDGYVLSKTVVEIRETMPKNAEFFKYIWTIRDPATLAVLLEDAAACLGIVMCIAGISASHATAMPVFDGMAGVGISCLLGSMGLVLVRVNHRFLLGQGVDRDITEGIEKIILSRRSIDNVYSIQSQWTGPETFSFKAEVDFDGTFLAAQLMPRYTGEFQKAHAELDQELEVLLCWYAEDVMRAVEREVRHIEAKIRKKYPGAEYIELEPMSKDADRFAIDDSFEEKLSLIEKQEMESLIKVLYHSNNSLGISSGGDITSPSALVDGKPVDDKTQ